MEAEERIQAVSQFLLQSPPGEINDVLNGTVTFYQKSRSRSALTIYAPPPPFSDVRVLIGDDESLEMGVLPALQQYNLEQFTVAEVPGAGHNVRRHLSSPRSLFS